MSSPITTREVKYFTVKDTKECKFIVPKEIMEQAASVYKQYNYKMGQYELLIFMRDESTIIMNPVEALHKVDMEEPTFYEGFEEGTGDDFEDEVIWGKVNSIKDSKGKELPNIYIPKNVYKYTIQMWIDDKDLRHLKKISDGYSLWDALQEHLKTDHSKRDDDMDIIGNGYWSVMISDDENEIIFHLDDRFDFDTFQVIYDIVVQGRIEDNSNDKEYQYWDGKDYKTIKN